MFHDRPALRALNETAWKAMLWGIETSPLVDDDEEPNICGCDHCGEDFTPRDISEWRVGLCLTCYIRQRDREAGGY
jgi:hypothetical protein